MSVTRPTCVTRAIAAPHRPPSIRASTAIQPSRDSVLRLIMAPLWQGQFPGIEISTHSPQTVLKTSLHQATAAEQHAAFEHQVEGVAEVLDHEIAILVHGYPIGLDRTRIALEHILHCWHGSLNIAIRRLAEPIPQPEFIRRAIVDERPAKGVAICHHDVTLTHILDVAEIDLHGAPHGLGR